MDCGKRPSKLGGGVGNSTLYMDLKDIVREHVLPFLPAKSLFRFRCVCKDWKLQISTPFFAHNQTLSCRSVLGVFCQMGEQPPKLIPFDQASCGVPDPCFGFLPDSVYIRSSSNGLLLCQVRSGANTYYICNPLTQQWKKLPKPNAVHGHDPAIVLIFEPSLLNFDADYKVVCAFPSEDFDNATEFEIYSSKEGSWKISGEICFASRSPVPSSGVHVNGVVYWTVRQGGILAYDVTKDRFLLLQHGYGVGTLGSINGKLCSASGSGHMITLNELDNIHTNTMQMQSRVRMWKEKYRITLDKAVGGDYRGQTVVFVGGDMVVGRGGERMFSYDLKTRVTTALHMPPDDNNLRCVPYVNSLVYI